MRFLVIFLLDFQPFGDNIFAKHNDSETYFPTNDQMSTLHGKWCVVEHELVTEIPEC